MKIKATSDLNAEATNIQNCIEVYTFNFNQLTTIIDTIPSHWKGKDADSFIVKFKEEIFPELRKYETVFQEYQEYLTGVYKVFSGLEEEYDKEIV